MMHRTREARHETGRGLTEGPVKVDETYIAGKRANMPNPKRKERSGLGPVGKAVVAGAKNRQTKWGRARLVDSPAKVRMQGFVSTRVRASVRVYTDVAPAHTGLMGYRHAAQQMFDFVAAWTGKRRLYRDLTA